LLGFPPLIRLVHVIGRNFETIFEFPSALGYPGPVQKFFVSFPSIGVFQLETCWLLNFVSYRIPPKCLSSVLTSLFRLSLHTFICLNRPSPLSFCCFLHGKYKCLINKLLCIKGPRKLFMLLLNSRGISSCQKTSPHRLLCRDPSHTCLPPLSNCLSLFM